MKLNSNDLTTGQLQSELARLESSIEHREGPSILHGRVADLCKAIAGRMDSKNWVQIHDLSDDPPSVYTCKARADAKDSTDASVYDSVLQHDDTITMGKVIGCPARFIK